MKKILIGLLAVSATFVASAAKVPTWNWQTSIGGNVYTPGSTSVMLDGVTAYLFGSSSASQIYTDWVKGTAVSEMSGSLDSQSVASGVIATKATFEYDVDPLSAIFATEFTVGEDKYLYISPVVSKDASDTGFATLKFNAAATSQQAASIGSYTGAGWYTQATPVPEPFSGALALLGVGLVGLRRRIRLRKSYGGQVKKAKK